MKITIVGAGPGGLCAARILKDLDPRHEVQVLERRRRDDTPGLGITLPAPALEVVTLDDPQPTLLAELTPSWSTAEIHVNREGFRFPFEELVGVSRAALVAYLVRRCEDHGVTVAFDHEVTDVARLAAECDLLIGADGVGSVVRAHHREAFGEQFVEGANLFAWLGAAHGPPQMRLGFQQTAHGMLQCASYPYAVDRSTVIMECSPAAWRGLGLADERDRDGVIDARGLATLAGTFEELLEGAELLDVGATWRHFRAVRTTRLHHANVALLGDAAASMYYSLGCGTMMAVEAAATLAALVCASPSLADALAGYEGELRPQLEQVQRASEMDLRGMARLDSLPRLDPEAFARAYTRRFG